MKLTTQMARRTARTMKLAARQGVDPRNTHPTQARIYTRLLVKDMAHEANKAMRMRKAWSMSDALNIWDVEGDLR